LEQKHRKRAGGPEGTALALLLKLTRLPAVHLFIVQTRRWSLYAHQALVPRFHLGGGGDVRVESRPEPGMSGSGGTASTQMVHKGSPFIGLPQPV
jgi:hypothetical protein